MRHRMGERLRRHERRNALIKRAGASSSVSRGTPRSKARPARFTALALILHTLRSWVDAGLQVGGRVDIVGRYQCLSQSALNEEEQHHEPQKQAWICIHERRETPAD